MGDIPVLAFLDRKILNSLSNRIIYKGLCGGGYIDLTLRLVTGGKLGKAGI